MRRHCGTAVGVWHQAITGGQPAGCTRQRVDPPFKPPTLLNGLGCWFQVWIEAPISVVGPLTERNEPRRMAWRVMTEKRSRAEVPGDDTAPWLVRVGLSGPFPGQPPQVGVQHAEGMLGHPDPVVGDPPGDDRVGPRDERVRVGPRRAVACVDSRSAIPPHCLLARLGQQLAVGIAADAEPEEVEPPSYPARSAEESPGVARFPLRRFPRRGARTRARGRRAFRLGVRVRLRGPGWRGWSGRCRGCSR